jgi:NADH-quinone oxidoreductase subunit J
LLFTLFGIAGLYVLLGADFVAIVQLIVYVGGILILLIFGVMITNKITEVEIKTGTIHTLPAAIGVGLFTGIVGAVILNTEWFQVDTAMPQSTLSTLGNMLLNEYVLIFELLGILLLVALIGAASMARK